MAERPADDSADEGLLELLAVEQRLQRQVQAARDDARRLIVDAQARCERRVAEARDDAERADTERARTEAIAHEQALSDIDATNRAVLADIARISDEHIDQLARWALAQAIAEEGDLT
jgi:hypothetical protein